MIVLSLFDGMSCGRLALDRAGISVGRYVASEIDQHAIKVSASNWSDVEHIGDINKLSYVDGKLLQGSKVIVDGKIDLVLAGSPCQGFSLAGKMQAFDDPRSRLFYKFLELLQAVKAYNPDVKWLLENVKTTKEVVNKLSDHVGVQPVMINSSALSAQNRPRLYWTNIRYGPVEDKGVKLPDILELGVPELSLLSEGRMSWLRKYKDVKIKGGYISIDTEKSKCLTVRGEPSWNCTYVTRDGVLTRLTPIEWERLQTVPDHYTSAASTAQRYKMLGNGWTVDVVAHILSNLKENK